MGLLEVLTVLFVALKLLDVIDWSWWLVFSPMYIYLVIFVVLVISGVIKGISEVMQKSRK